MKKNNRVLFIDIARGIAILLMIAGHVLEFGVKRSIIFSFHMPLFIIVSGFFYKDRPIKEELKNMFFHLIIPSTIILFLTQIISNYSDMGAKSILVALKTIIVCWSHQYNIVYNFPSTGVLWFIYVIVLIKLLFIISKTIFKENDILLYSLIILETFIGCIVGITGYWLPWSIDVSFACMIFYYFGYVLKKYDILNMLLSNYPVIIVSLLLWIFGIKNSCIEIAVRYYPNGLSCFVTAICGTLVIFKLSLLLDQYVKKFSKALAWCGKNSLYILIGHYLESSFVNYNFYIYNNTLTEIILILIKCSISLMFAFFICIVVSLIKKLIIQEGYNTITHNVNYDWGKSE